MKRVYLDHNATTPLRPEAREEWLRVLDLGVANPSSPHAAGRAARQVIDEARERVAAALGVHEEGVVFTSGGTEADNLAVLGAVRAAGEGRGLVTTAVEHPAVLGPAAVLESEGRPVVRVSVDHEGRPDPDEIVAAAPGAALVAVQAANSELGTCPDLGAVGRGLSRIDGPGRPGFFTDAVQALGRVRIDLKGWGVDLAAFSGHKVGGPTGCGVLVKRGTTPLAPLTHGGSQEHDVRPGTENAAAISATAVAIELAVREQESAGRRMLDLARRLWTDLSRAVPEARLLGPPLEDEGRLPNTLCVLLPGVDARVGVTQLDLLGLEVSAGSACSSGSLEPSPVLRAIGLDDQDARRGLRISFGRTSTIEDVHIAVETLSTTCARARSS